MTELMRRVEVLRASVRASKERADELDQARQEGARRVDRARAELLEFYRRQGREGEPELDPMDLPLGQDGIVVEGMPGEPSEAELVAAVRDAEGGLTPKPVVVELGGGRQDVTLQAVDEAAEARYEGAVEALADRERELREFVGSNHVEITVERATVAASIRNQVTSLIAEARGVAAAWERFRSAEVELLNLAGREALVPEIPDNPLRWVQEAPTVVPLPMPESFTG
jgi:hypothetical protein